MLRSTAAAIAARSRSQRSVLPSMSVKRKVTVPLGSVGIDCLRRLVAGAGIGIVARAITDIGQSKLVVAHKTV